MSLIVKAGGGSSGIKYTGPNPLTIGQAGYVFEPKTLLKDGLTIVNGVNGEDLTDTAANQTATVASLMAMVKRKVSENRGEGEYVWKKYENINATLTFTHTATGTPSKFLVESNDIDLSTIDASFFVGFSGNATYGGSNYPFEFADGTVTLNGNVTAYTYDASTHTLSLPSFKTNGTLAFPNYVVTRGALLDYVVSDDKNAYPDNGVQDGYLYIKGESGLYAWKKYKIVEGTINITQISGATAVPAILQLSSDEIDFATLDFNELTGLTSAYGTSSNPAQWTLKFNGASTVILDGNSYAMTWNANTAQMSINANFGNAVTFAPVKATVKQYECIVVSYDKTTYPNGGEQDGYWYELVEEEGNNIASVFGFTKYALDTFVSSANVLQPTIPHTLGETPQAYLLVANANDVSNGYASFIYSRRNGTKDPTVFYIDNGKEVCYASGTSADTYSSSNIKLGGIVKRI